VNNLLIYEERHDVATIVQVVFKSFETTWIYGMIYKNVVMLLLLDPMLPEGNLSKASATVLYLPTN
jgi:hypothetical protein